eukprot:2455518-Prymnesium_polylepis.1
MDPVRKVARSQPPHGEHRRSDAPLGTSVTSNESVTESPKTLSVCFTTSPSSPSRLSDALVKSPQAATAAAMAPCTTVAGASRDSRPLPGYLRSVVLPPVS